MPEAKLEIDAASALHLGRRDTQEDAVASDFPIGGAVGIVVLADGMGGHNAGETASKIVVTEVYSELKLQSSQLARDHAGIPKALRQAAAGANDCLRRHNEVYPETLGMGTTLVAVVQMSDALHWISIGDSLLFVFRNGKLKRLNADHSMAPQIDLMVEQGELLQEVADNHPQRNCLTSAMTGEPIPKTDCPDTPFKLMPGDIIVVASDGLQFLSDDAIASVLNTSSHMTSSEIARALVRSVAALDDPEQDNLACAVAKVTGPRPIRGETKKRRAPRASKGAEPRAAPPAIPVSEPAFVHRLRRIASNLF